MAKIRGEIIAQTIIGQLKEGLDQDTFDINGGKPVYLRHSHKDPDDEDNETYVVHGDVEYGPFHQVRLLDLESDVPVFIVTDTELTDRLFVGKTMQPFSFDHIEDETVEFDETGNPYFRALNGEGECVVHGSWQSEIHTQTGIPFLHKGMVVYTATDHGKTSLFCKEEEIVDGFDRLWVTDIKEHVDATDLVCGAVKDKTVLELRIRIA